MKKKKLKKMYFMWTNYSSLHEGKNNINYFEIIFFHIFHILIILFFYPRHRHGIQMAPTIEIQHVFTCFYMIDAG